MVGAQDYALFRLCFCEGHKTLLPPSCHLVQKRECNVDAPLGPEQDLKLLFPCNPKDPLRIPVKIRLGYVHLFAVLWAMGLPLHLAVPPPSPLPSPSPLPLSTRDVQASPRGGTPSLHMAS